MHVIICYLLGTYQSLLLNQSSIVSNDNRRRNNKRTVKVALKRSNTSLPECSVPPKQRRDPYRATLPTDLPIATSWTDKFERLPSTSCLERYNSGANSSSSTCSVSYHSSTTNDVNIENDNDRATGASRKLLSRSSSGSSAGSSRDSSLSGSSTATEANMKGNNNKVYKSPFDKLVRSIDSKTYKPTQRELNKKKNLNKSSAGVLFSSERQPIKKKGFVHPRNSTAISSNSSKTRTCTSLVKYDPSHAEANRLHLIPTALQLNSTDSSSNKNFSSLCANRTYQTSETIQNDCYSNHESQLMRISECSESSTSLNNTSGELLELPSDSESPSHQVFSHGSFGNVRNNLNNSEQSYSSPRPPGFVINTWHLNHRSVNNNYAEDRSLVLSSLYGENSCISLQGTSTLQSPIPDALLSEIAVNGSCIEPIDDPILNKLNLPSCVDSLKSVSSTTGDNVRATTSPSLSGESDAALGEDGKSSQLCLNNSTSSLQSIPSIHINKKNRHKRAGSDGVVYYSNQSNSNANCDTNSLDISAGNVNKKCKKPFKKRANHRGSYGSCLDAMAAKSATTGTINCGDTGTRLQSGRKSSPASGSSGKSSCIASAPGSVGNSTSGKCRDGNSS